MGIARIWKFKFPPKASLLKGDAAGGGIRGGGVKSVSYASEVGLTPAGVCTCSSALPLSVSSFFSCGRFAKY